MPAHIQIGDTRPRVQYVASGAQTVFPYPFPIFQAVDLHVYQDDTRVTSGFSVTGAGASDGGSVTFTVAPAAGTRITLVRRLALTRITDFQAGGPLRAATLNDELDYLTAVDQQLDDALSRTVRLAPGAAESAGLILPPPQPGAVLGWNDSASALVNDPVDFAGLATEIQSARDDLQAALGTVSAAIVASATAVTAAGEAESWAQDTALSAWLVGLNEDGAGVALSTAVVAAAAAERWAEDAALSAWLASLSGNGSGEVETLLVRSPMLTLNHGEVGAGVTAGVAGMVVDRGTETVYRFAFRESDDAFVVGPDGTEQAVATRQDAPEANAVPYWNAAAVRLDSVPGFTWDGAALTLPAALRYAAAQFRVSSAAAGTSVTIDLSHGEVQVFTLSADTIFTLPDPAAGYGYSVTLKLIQDATGNRVPGVEKAGGVAAVWLGGAPPAWQTTDGAFDLVVLTHDGSDLIAAHAGGAS
ncbi:hypothetical protein [Roseospira goensis]|uniref:DUF1983 domain-containing protein n=1 Tax=Roseospira goensis TaxID=391922 RepID=A0A7W6WJF0_9PROT|nr:hypothetical protein [Roseospira goensis]MBB4285121.1 hypothetical protein [Roseospira goensis]